MKRIIIFFLTLYQYTLSPILHVVLGTTCRYEETCSQFAKRVIREKGIITGSYLALKRFLSCQPFGTIRE